MEWTNQHLTLARVRVNERRCAQPCFSGIVVDVLVGLPRGLAIEELQAICRLLLRAYRYLV